MNKRYFYKNLMNPLLQHARRYHKNVVSKMYPKLTATLPDKVKYTCKSYKLMLYYGLVDQSSPGCFHLLPLAVRSVQKLKKVIREEMSAVGAEEISMPCLTSAELWKKSGRWDTAGSELFKLKNRRDLEYCLGPTHEEAITSMVAKQVLNPKVLPLKLYQITKKFRDEARPNYGLLRGREFDMKDMYTFDVNETAALDTYDQICGAYEKIFSRLGLPYLKVAGNTGNIGGSMSHEYHFPSAIGQDTLLVCDTCGHGINKEVLHNSDTVCSQSDCNGNFIECNGIEVGHSFLLGTKYSAIFDAKVVQQANISTPAEMGCYGLGVTRMLAAAVEVLSLDDQIRWPHLIAPYQVCIIPQMEGHKVDVTMNLADSLYDKLSSHASLRNEVLLDDRIKLTIGNRIQEAKRMGYPYLVILGKRALDDPPEIEVIDVNNNITNLCSYDGLCDRLLHYVHGSSQEV